MAWVGIIPVCPEHFMWDFQTWLLFNHEPHGLHLAGNIEKLPVESNLLPDWMVSWTLDRGMFVKPERLFQRAFL